MFLEKPLAGTLVAARGLIEIAKRHDTLVMMGFSFRFQPVVVKARELLSGPLGNVLLAQGDYVFDWPAPADGWLWDRNRGGGLLTENSCHLFDIISHLMGRPLGVTAHGATMAGAPGPNAINLILDFANGSSAGLMLGTVGARASSPSPHLQIYTEHGHLTLSGRDHIWVGLQYGRRDDTGANVFLDDPEKLSRTRYSAALDHFADCITTGSPTTATLEDGLWSVELADAAYRSMEIGARVVLGGTLT